MRQAPLAAPRVPDESAPRARLSRAPLLRALALFGVAASLALAGPVAAQDEDVGSDDDDTDTPEPTTTRVNGPSGSAPMPADFSGSLQIVRGPATANGGATPGSAPEIFPEASRVFMSVRDTDPVPIETARRGGPWLCSAGQCTTTLGDAGQSRIGDDMLRSIKLQTPTLPLPLTIWGRLDEQGKRTLDFDPVLLGRRDYRHVCAYPPVAPNDKTGPRKVEKAPLCRDDVPVPALPDSAEVLLGMQWPKQSEMADFRYLAIVDSCGNARVQPFQRTFTVPVFEVASGGCGKADGKVLRIFPSGGWLRVTAFNLDNTAAGTVVNATYRVSVPPLENLVESNPARMLFPDPQLEDLKVDCGPAMRRPAAGPPSGPPSLTPPPGVMPKAPAAAPPPAASKESPREPDAAGLAARPAPKPGDKPDVQAAKRPAPKATPVAPRTTPMGPPRPSLPMKATAPAGPGPQPLAHMSLVIAPEPLRQGVCRVRLSGSTKGRLVAPLALYVSLTRTDRTSNGAPIELLNDHKWIVTPNSSEFQLPPLAENFDGDSRLRLAVYSDPLNTDGKVVLVSDATRVAASLRSGG